MIEKNILCFPDFYNKIKSNNVEKTWEIIHSELQQEDWIGTKNSLCAIKNYPNKNMVYFILSSNNSIWLFSYKDIIFQKHELKNYMLSIVENLLKEAA